jgi:hypothetical protein
MFSVDQNYPLWHLFDVFEGVLGKPRSRDEHFEFKIRERVILKTILDRKGALDFPEPDLI